MSGRQSLAGPSVQPQRTTKSTHPNLPPELILGPDGKPCKVCNSWQDWAKLKINKTGNSPKSATGMGDFASMMSNTSQPTSTYSSVSPQQLDRQDCPADTALLGRSTWTFLHTTAAYYPVRAPPGTQTSMLKLLSSISLLYPCVSCADGFRGRVAENPPDVSGREGLSRWLCERHNEVNEKLGKERFDCAGTSLDRRWKDGPEDGSCG
ncbi:MAG: hypothetical protein TREMPRED_003690 [Tremellales sp. Tagirdzhanova-0007]|nr:MAG: hypothetical protein TREMPRED_003690 [Tremellales sp. Tagirdzhanova-0007]